MRALSLRGDIMSTKSQHVIKDINGGWSVKKGGSSRASKHFDNQNEAIVWGRNVARNQHAEFYIHDRDGKICEKDSFSK